MYWMDDKYVGRFDFIAGSAIYGMMGLPLLKNPVHSLSTHSEETDSGVTEARPFESSRLRANAKADFTR